MKCVIFLLVICSFSVIGRKLWCVLCDLLKVLMFFGFRFRIVVSLVRVVFMFLILFGVMLSWNVGMFLVSSWLLWL